VEKSSLHDWINSLGIVLSIALTAVLGVCTLQSQELDRDIAAANRARDQAALQKSLKVARFAPTLASSATLIDIDFRAGNTGGSATTLVSVGTTEISAIVRALLPAPKPLNSIGLQLIDPPGPSHLLHPALRIEPHGVVDFTIRVSIDRTAATVDVLRELVRREGALAIVEVKDVDDEISTAILWDCGPKLSFGKPVPACSGGLFDGS